MSSDISHYHHFVTRAAARNAGLVNSDGTHFGDEFRALISTRTTDARDNTASTGRGVPIHYLGGDKMADDYADFYDGSWDTPNYGRDELGRAKRNGLVWTGSNADGTKGGLGTYAGKLGWPGVYVTWASVPMDRGALSEGQTNIESTRHLYALSPVLTVASEDLAQRAVRVALKQIEVGMGHACALDRSGRVTCWGDDSSGQVSDWGRQRHQHHRFASISAGSFLTCGILASGSVTCWGYPEREDGSHAESSNEDWTTWTARTTQTGYTGWVNTPPARIKFKPDSLSVGNYHACAIQTTGELSCWGKAGSDRLVIPTVATENNREVIKSRRQREQDHGLDHGRNGLRQCLRHPPGRLGGLLRPHHLRALGRTERQRSRSWTSPSACTTAAPWPETAPSSAGARRASRSLTRSRRRPPE